MVEKLLWTAAGPFLLALVYFTGFCYLYSYFNFFGISPLETDFSVQYVFTHAFPAIYKASLSFWWIIVTLIVMFGAIVFGLSKLSLTNKVPVISTILILSAIASFMLAYRVGRYSGTEQAMANLQNMKLLAIKSEPPFGASDGLRHIITTDDTVYALKFSGDGDDFWTIRIPSDKIGFSQVYMD